MNKAFIALITGATLLAACNGAVKSESKATAAKPDILKENLDTTVNPADDFFQYAAGGWISRNPIPADRTTWGIGPLVQEDIYSRLKTINEEAAKNAKTPIDQKIGAFWQSGMDTAGIEKAGLSPLKPELDRIQAAADYKSLMSVAARLHTMGVGVFFSDFPSQDAKNSEVMAYYLYQGGLGLPDRDYYFNNDERTMKVRTAYPAFAAKMFGIMGSDSTTAAAKARSLIALETRLAKASRTVEALRDPYANYNKMA
ncbi:MAG: M13 family peptidase, partial [Sphingobacteriales bacterium]